MSVVVHSQTPFIHRDILLEALCRIGEDYKVLSDGSVETSRVDYEGNQTFILVNGKYVLRHELEENTYWGYPRKNRNSSTRDFLRILSVAYSECLKEHLDALKREQQQQEKERLRIEMERREQERKAFIERQEKNILEKAKANGYHVTRKEIGGKIRLILSRTR